MEIIPQLIKNYSIVLYAVCGIACAYFIFTGLASLRELRRAVFRLERSAVVSRAVSAWLKALLCLLAAGAIFIISSLAPARGADTLLANATPTLGSVLAPTSMATARIDDAQIKQVDLVATATPVSDTAVTTGTLVLTQTLEVTPTVQEPVAAEVSETPPPAETAPAPAAPQVAADCSNPEAQFTAPSPGETVAGIYTVRGTAIVEAGGYYKVEVLTPGALQWSFLGRGDTSVQNGELLSNFDFSAIGPGNHLLRLMLVKLDSNESASCTIPLTIGQ